MEESTILFFFLIIWIVTYVNCFRLIRFILFYNIHSLILIRSRFHINLQHFANHVVQDAAISVIS